MNKTPTFDDFWREYPLHRGKKDAERAWNRLSARDKRAALAAIPAYREEIQRTGMNIKYPQGWLNGRRWEDELDTPAPSTSKAAAVPCGSPQGDAPPQKGNIPPSLPLKGLTPWQTQDDPDTPPADALEAMATW